MIEQAKASPSAAWDTWLPVFYGDLEEDRPQ